MAVNKVVKSDGTTLIDLSDDTVTSAEHIMSGHVGHLANGSQATGTGQGSSWTKICEASYEISTTSTSATTIAKLATGISEAVANAKIVYVRIRDTAGKRAGYFYGSDSYYNSPPNSDIAVAKNIVTYNASGEYECYNTGGTAGYGVYTTYLAASGNLTIRARCHSTYAPTIDGTYKVEVYTLDYPDGVSPFT